MIPKYDGFFLQIAVKARGTEFVEFSILYLHCQAMKHSNEKSIFTMCLCVKPLSTESSNVKQLSEKSLVSD